MKSDRLAWNLHLEASADQFASDEISLGPWTSYSLKNDPKHMAFVLARYKFCAKMFAGKESVLEVGCGDGFGAPIVAQEVGCLHCVDWDKRNIVGNRRRLACLTNVTFDVADVSEGEFPGMYDGVFHIDVIEHMEPDHEAQFMANMAGSLREHGVMVVGTPNKAASEHATFRSEHQHINLKTGETLRALMARYFHNVFMFSMNDEVIHTGYFPMAHYLFAVGAGVK
ncbi:MAG: class I SAM-dependent methyltransferase [Burkholderiales bacterium]